MKYILYLYPEYGAVVFPVVFGGDGSTVGMDNGGAYG
jgi:hypothetical protein